jgi:hypothetical protein
MTTLLAFMFSYAVWHFASSVRDRVKFLEGIHQAEKKLTANFFITLVTGDHTFA